MFILTFSAIPLNASSTTIMPLGPSASQQETELLAARAFAASEPLVAQSSSVAMDIKPLTKPPRTVTSGFVQNASFSTKGSAIFSTFLSGKLVTFSINSSNSQTGWTLSKNSTTVEQHFIGPNIDYHLYWKVRSDLTGFKLAISYSCQSSRTISLQFFFNAVKFKGQLGVGSPSRWVIGNLADDLSKKNFGFDWTDMAGASQPFDATNRILKFICSGTGILDPSTVTTGADVSILQPNSKVFKASNSCFYVAANNANLAVFSSTDETTWTSRLTKTASGAIYVSGTTMWVISGATGGTTIKREQDTINGDCTITAGTNYDATTSASIADTSLYKVVSCSTRSYLMYQASGGAPRAITNSLADFSGTDTDNLLESGATMIPAQLACISSNKAYAQWPTSAGGNPKGRTLNTDGTMTAIETISSTNFAINPVSGSLIDIGSTLTFAWRTAAGTVKAIQKSDGASSWGTEYTVAALTSVGVCLATDGTLGYSYIWDNPSGSTWTLYRYALDTSGNVGSQQTVISSESNLYNGGSSGYAFPFGCEMQTIAAQGTSTLAWLQGTANPYNVREGSESLPAATATQPITCTMDNSGTQVTLDMSGGGITPATKACNASSTNFTCNNTFTITATEPADAANTRARFAGSTTTRSVTCSTTAWTFTNYYQLRNTFQVTANAQSTFDAGLSLAVSGTRVGGSVTVCTISPTGGQATGSCQDWSDYGRAATGLVDMTGAPANSRWRDSSGAGFTFASPTTGGNTYNRNEYKQWTNQYRYSLTGGGSPTGPTLTYNSLGASTGTVLTTTLQSIYIDNANTPTLTNPLTESTSSERWRTNDSPSSVTTGGASNTFAYYHQYACTCSYTLTGGGSPTAPTFNGQRYGAATTDTLSTASATVWVDNSFAWSATNPLTGSSNTERWVAPSGTSGTVSAAFTVNPSYYHQYLITPNNSLAYTYYNNATLQPSTTANKFADATKAVTVTGTYQSAFNIGQPTYLYQEGSQGFQLWSNVVLSSIMYAGNPNNLRYTGTSATNVTMFEITALQNTIGPVSKLYANQVSVSFAWSATTGFMVSGSVSCASYCEIDFTPPSGPGGGGGGSTGGGGGSTGGGGGSTGGGGGGGGGGTTVFITSTTTQTTTTGYNPGPIGNPELITGGALTAFLLLSFVFAARYYEQTNDAQEFIRKNAHLKVPNWGMRTGAKTLRFGRKRRKGLP